MKATRYDGTDARRVLTGMITDPVVATRIAARWHADGLFASPWENKVGAWCVEHARKYGVAPGPAIETIFIADPGRNPDETAAIEKFLGSLSDAYAANGSAPAAEYIIDLAGRLFDRVALKRDAEAVLAELELGNVEAAKAKFTAHRLVDFGPGAVDMPDSDEAYWTDVYSEDDTRPLFEYRGALGEFVGAEFSRDAFIAFQASEGRGKSYFLMDCVAVALRQRCRVGYFVTGDMSRKQAGRRLGRRFAMRPRKDGNYKVPTDWEETGYVPVLEERQYEAVTPYEAYRLAHKYSEGRNRLRIITYPAATASAATIEQTLKEWAREGWVADVVVIDYADILAPPPGLKDEQEQVNANWLHMRRLSQTLHCCVITATQANAASYEATTMRRKHFSRDKRKYGHITAMIGVNQTEEEKRVGVYRWNWLKRRDADYRESDCVYIAGNLDLGCPAIISKR